MAFLITDICFLSLVVTALVFIALGIKKPNVRNNWEKLLRKPVASASLVVLLFFMAIGTLDCLHWPIFFHESTEQSDMTLLDKLLHPLDNQDEKTYSKPFALQSFTPDFVLKEGSYQKIYPRLNYPPLQFENDAMVKDFVEKQISFYFFIISFSALIIFYVVRYFFREWHRGFLTMFITFFICLFCVVLFYSLSRYFHIFGTGKIGQDIFYQSIKSIRTALIIGSLTTVLMAPLAIILGISAGYHGGKIDDVVQYVYTTLSSIPGVLLVTASVLSMQTFIVTHPQYFKTLLEVSDARLLALCVILGVTSWTSLCRLLRAEALKLRHMDFVLASVLLGRGTFSIFLKHLLPNVMPIVLMALVMDFSFLILAEAVLSYIGAGVSPLTISWGNMINGARLELSREPVVWWPMLAAFVSMFSLVLASNLFADNVREVLDPHES